ncbi:hypothetical protein K474DRAFT_1678508 [Panus rudis PR-1116 ss-1]|nr:hypothetical protein K474DRAFT_1678508 [Panus rudis PR-1116 ss-1]
MSSEPPPLPNPLTPLAWLPPDVANQLEASRYLYSAVLGAWLWEILTAMPDDVRMWTRHGFGISDVVYVLSKLLTGGFVLTTFTFQVAPVGSCHALAMAIGWTGGFAISLNSILFFYRVRAVFANKKIVVYFFAFLWLATFGCAMTIPFGVDGVHIGTTKNCVNSDVKPFSSAAMIVIAVNDTLVFFAISVQLLMQSLADTWSERIKAFFSGRGMGNISRSLLHTGQLYYLATVGVNIVSMAVILAPSVPPVFRAMFAIPNFSLQNAMACRVYRLLKLGLLNDRPSGFTHSSSQPSRYISSSIRPGTYRTNPDRSFTSGSGSQGKVESFSLEPTSYRAARDLPPVPMHVNISHETEVARDGSITDFKPEGLA